MAGAMILLFQAVPLPTSFETNLRSERRNSLVYRKKSQRNEKPVPAVKTPKSRMLENTQKTNPKTRILESTPKTTPELLRRISGNLETQELPTSSIGTTRPTRRHRGARRSLRFAPAEDEVDNQGEVGDLLWGGIGQELRLIADRMVAARVVEYQGRTDYYVPSEATSTSPNVFYSFLMVALLKYICSLFTKFI